LVIHFTQVDGESWKANYFGVGVGIGVGIEKVLFDPDSDSDPDPDPIHLSEGHNQKQLILFAIKDEIPCPNSANSRLSVWR
jgi:hypothetical protein